MAEKSNIGVPQSVESEEALLGAIITDSNILSNVIEYLQADDFYSKVNATIYKACEDVVDEGQTIDVFTLCNMLEKKGELEKVGGYGYITSLLDGKFLTSNAETYAKNIVDKSLMRKLAAAGRRIASEACDEGSTADDILVTAQKEILDVSRDTRDKSYTHISEVTTNVYLQIEENTGKGGISGVPSGFVDLDKIVAGFKPADLIIVGGRPGMGKTAFMLEIARYVAVKKNLPVVVFNLEMSKEQLATRLLSSQSRVNNEKIKKANLNQSDWNDLAQAVMELNQAPIYIDDTVDSSVQNIRAKCRRIKREHNIALIVVDYLQLMTSKGKNDGNRVNEVADISRQLKMMGRELGVPVMVGSQLSRAVEGRDDKRPQLADLRESGNIEQDADLVLFLYRDVVYHPDTQYKNVAEVIIGKHRNGELDTVKLSFDGEHTAFRNLAK